MKPVTILKRARALIEKPANWTKGAAARDKYGVAVNDTDPRACAYCAWGAIDRAAQKAGASWDEVLFPALDLFEAAARTPIIGAWNDNRKRTHPQVLAAFDKAIALAQKQEATL